MFFVFWIIVTEKLCFLQEINAQKLYFSGTIMLLADITEHRIKTHKLELNKQFHFIQVKIQIIKTILFK